MEKNQENILTPVISNTFTHRGEELAKLSFQSPLMLVFLRHFGCTFCREVLRDLGQIRSQIEAKGIQLVVVHMSPPDYAEKMLVKFQLAGIEHISDPSQKLYRAFDLKRGRIPQLFGWNMWKRGFQAGILEGLGVGRERGDGFQMPGYFLLEKGNITHEYIPSDAADHPDYLNWMEAAKH